MSIKGDFISFTYNGVHSTELGIVRTSSSNRYNDQLVPTSQDKTVAVPGGNGTYFFGSNYTQRAITLNIAYDEVTEATLRRMRKVFSADTVHPLIFDDAPYKVYYAKVSGQPQLNYIPFQNYDSDFLGGTPRIYKGEGTINFVCYDPFAHCPNDYKYLSTYEAGVSPTWYKYNNSNEWNLSAGLLEDKTVSIRGGGGTIPIIILYDTYIESSGFYLYNPGDEEADFKFIIPIEVPIQGIKIGNASDLENHILMLNGTIVPKGNDTHICFNSKLNIIQGYKDGEPTGNVYNEYIGSGEWFKIPIIDSVGLGGWYFIPIIDEDYTYSLIDIDEPILKYDYLYY